jgi:plastocyanin
MSLEDAMTEPSQQAIEPDRDASPNDELGKGDRRRRVIRPLGLALPVALLSLVTACSSSTPASSTLAAGSGAVAAGSVLTGTVGQGDAPVITLVDSAGAPVTSLKAGSYTVKVKDESTKHDFHLTGPGVDQKTSVPETTEATWTVKLSAGTYTFVCDPHAATMKGSFTVT